LDGSWSSHRKLEREHMRSMARKVLGGVAAVVAGLSSVQAQTTYPNVKVTGRLQEQFYYFDNSDYAAIVGPKDNFFTRRAGSKGTFYIRGGQEKRPYSRYELTSSNNLVSIERGAGQGLVPRASNDIFSAAGFISHDVGASARYEYKINDLQLVTVKFGVYNG